MSYHHFTIEERCCLREYYKKGYSYRKIAELMGRNVSSISRIKQFVAFCLTIHYAKSTPNPVKAVTYQIFSCVAH